jgi:hypothetical protein
MSDEVRRSFTPVEGDESQNVFKILTQQPEGGEEAGDVVIVQQPEGNADRGNEEVPVVVDVPDAIDDDESEEDFEIFTQRPSKRVVEESEDDEDGEGEGSQSLKRSHQACQNSCGCCSSQKRRRHRYGNFMHFEILFGFV